MPSGAGKAWRAVLGVSEEMPFHSPQTDPISARGEFIASIGRARLIGGPSNDLYAVRRPWRHTRFLGDFDFRAVEVARFLTL
jgi:hypothetical protein